MITATSSRLWLLLIEHRRERGAHAAECEPQAHDTRAAGRMVHRRQQSGKSSGPPARPHIIVRVGTVITVPRAHGKPVREHLMCKRVRALGRPASAGNWGRTLTCRRGTARSAAPARRGGAPQTRAPSKRGNSLNWDQRPFEIEKTIEMRGPRGDRRNETGCQVRRSKQQLSVPRGRLCL